MHLVPDFSLVHTSPSAVKDIWKNASLGITVDVERSWFLFSILFSNQLCVYFLCTGAGGVVSVLFSVVDFSSCLIKTVD